MPYTVGPYHLLEKIGEGGLSDIHLAVKENRPYAVKSLKSEKTKDPEVISNFIREVRIASKLDHPNINKILDQGKVNDTHFSVTRLLLGETLLQVINDWKQMERKVPLPLSLYVIKECCKTLAYLHRQTVFEHSVSVLFHGDLAPDNVMLIQDGSVRLIDFGSAGQESSASPTRRHFGKLFYLPPEIIQGESPGTATDIYALGVITFYLLFGQRPFGGKTNLELTEAILNTPAPRLECDGLVKDKNAENALRIFFNKALHKDRKVRFATAEEFDQALSQVPLAARPPEDLLEVRRLFHENFVQRLKERDASWIEKIRSFKPSGDAAGAPIESLLDAVDRRRHPRISMGVTSLKAEIVDPVDKVKTEALVVEISQGGMLVKWQGLVPRKGQEYPVSIPLGAEYRTVTTMAKLLYEIKIQAKNHAGFMFTALSQTDHATLARYVETHAKTPAARAHRGGIPVIDMNFDGPDVLGREFEKNIRHGGMMADSPQPLQNDEAVILRIHFPHTLKTLSLQGKVVFSTPGGGEKYGTALQLTNNPELIRAAIQEF